MRKKRESENMLRQSDEYYLDLAYQIASQSSEDPSTNNGAVLVLPTNEFVSAVNCFPARVKKTWGRLERPLKYQFMEHAERNVIYTAAWMGWKTLGATLFVPWFACSDCARAIIQSGIVEVVGHDCPLHKQRPDWKASVENGLLMLEEAGVKTRWIKKRFGREILFDGKKEVV